MAIVKFPRLTPSAPVFSGIPGMEVLPNRIRRMFDDAFFGIEPGLPESIGLVPPAEVVETRSELLLNLELPGMTRKDVEVNVEEGVLTIHGEKVQEQKEGEEKKFLLWERTYGSFTRSFTLPNSVDPAGIVATFENGVLTVKLPKTAEARAKGRRIEIAEK